MSCVPNCIDRCVGCVTAYIDWCIPDKCVALADKTTGKYPLEVLPKGWTNAEVTYLSQGKENTRIEILDMKGNRYWQEPMFVIAIKCFLLFFVGLPGYFLVYTAVHLIRLPIVTLWNGSPTALFKQIWAIVRIPFYLIGLECAALYGIFKPLDGRALFGEIESSLHDGKTVRDAAQHEKNAPPVLKMCLKMCWDTLSKKVDPYAFFIGFCMQPYGKVTDPHIISVRPVQAQTPPGA